MTSDVDVAATDVEIDNDEKQAKKPDENFKPDLVGGYNLNSMRAHFDPEDKNIIVASDRHLFYYSVESGEQVGKASLSSSKLTLGESIVACDRLGSSLYLFTSFGRVFLWSLEARDWFNELALPLNEGETLISCKMLSKRQYIYLVLDNANNTSNLYFSMSRSERERPKQREIIGRCYREQNSFDIGCIAEWENVHGENKMTLERLAKQRCLAYIDGPYIRFQKITIGEKICVDKVKQRIQENEFTCVRANPRIRLVAAGDSLGRIYLYRGDFSKQDFDRSKLHWHTLPVSDLCFSNTGNTLYSVGGESGCVVIWDVSSNNVGKKRLVVRLGMPVRFINCSNKLNQLILSFEDNELQFMDTNEKTRRLKTLTRRTYNMYTENNYKALRINQANHKPGKDNSIGLLWHSITDTVVTNGRTGWLQFYSPKTKSSTQALDCLKSNILCLEKDAKVVPSDITFATLTLDGNWIAFYETCKSDNSFPEVKLHIWQRSSTTNRWVWIQTADRLHTSPSITDLKFSADGQFLVSVSEDDTFQILYRVCLDSKLRTSQAKMKQMYAKGFVGHVPEGQASMATFSQDSSVMAMSLKNDTILIWMIVDPFKLVYECQLNQIEVCKDLPNSNEAAIRTKSSHSVLGLQFGYHKPSQSLAPLCEVRSNTIRIWNILNPQETMEYSAQDSSKEDGDDLDEFTATAFDLCPGDGRSLNHFAVASKKNHILIFRLQISQSTKKLRPLIVVDGNLPFSSPGSDLNYRYMCFLANPILDIDSQCHQDPQLVKLLNRLCLMNDHQELVSITDKLTIERQSASNSCNTIKTFDMGELQDYFAKSVSAYREETENLGDGNLPKIDSNVITEKQRKIRNRLEVQKMLKDLLMRIPSQNLPKIEILGPMILDRLT